MFKGAHPFYRSQIFFTFLVTVACFLFTYWYYGFYYVEYEALFDSFYSGSLTEGMPFRSIYFLGNIGTSHIYSLLYQISPGVEWISWILYGYLFVSCFIGLQLIADLLPQRTPSWVKFVAQVIIYLLVFADHNIHFIFTRVSYMATGLSLIALVYYFKAEGSVKQRPWLFIALNLWFVIGILTRSESGTAAFLQVAVFGVFYLYSVKRLVVIFAFPALFLLSVLGAIAYDIKTSKEFYKQIEPDIEAQFCERENAKGVADMKTYRDSVMVMAAKDIMWADPKVLTPTYLRSLILPEKFIYTDMHHWQRVYRNVSAIANRFWFMGLLALLLGVAILVQYPFKSKFNYVLWFGFIISFWALTALQTYTVKVNDRSFSPLISIFVLCNIVMLLTYTRAGVSRWLYPLLLAMVVVFGVHLNYLKTESRQLATDLAEYQQNRKLIASLAANKVLVINSSSCDYIFSSNRPFHPFSLSEFKKVYITDGYNMPFLPYYRRYLEKECGCNMFDYPSFWSYLRTRHQEVVVVSASQRIDIVKEYLRVIHGYDLPLTKRNDAELLDLEKSDYRGFFNKLDVYTLGP